MAPKKKTSKKQEAALAEQALELRLELEKEKVPKSEQEHQRVQQITEQAELYIKKEIDENRIRRKQLKASQEFFNQIQTNIFKIKIEQELETEWQEYMKCNGLPNPYDPGDLRKHIHIWELERNEFERMNRNWLLNVNERTVLTQNLTETNLTELKLRESQANLGRNYSAKIEEFLSILNDVDKVLLSKTPGKSILTDLKLLKSEMRSKLHEYIDDFTCQILSHIDRDMDIVSPGQRKHDFTTEAFKSEVIVMQGGDTQGPKDIKSRLDQAKHSSVDLPLLELNLSLPPFVDIMNSALRALWMRYDHFSDNCSSFEIPKELAKQQHHVTVSDLLEQTNREWRKRMQIIRETFDDMLKPIEPQNLGDLEVDQPNDVAQDGTVDIDKIHDEYEQKKHKIRQKSIGPGALNINLETDLNLRKYRIVGGCYSIDYLEIPKQDKQLNSKIFVRTVVNPEKLKMKEFFQLYKPPPPPLPGVRRLPEEIEAEMRMIESSLEKLAQVSIQLQPTVLWFEPPVVCRWETPQETLQSDRKSASMIKSAQKSSKPTQINTYDNSIEPFSGTSHDSIAQIRKLNARKKFPSIVRYLIKRFKQSTTSANLEASKEIQIRVIDDFDMCNLPENLNFYSLIVDFVVPRLPQGYLIKNDGEEICSTDKEISTEFLKCICKQLCGYLEQTDSPRSFYPNINFGKIIHVKASEKDTECETDTKMNAYTFSNLLHDLEELLKIQEPKLINEEVFETSRKVSSSEQQINLISKSNIESKQIKSSEKALIDTALGKFLQEFAAGSNQSEISIENSSINGNNSDTDVKDTADVEIKDPELLTETITEVPKTERTDRKPFEGKWSTRDVHDVRFNEDKLSLQFRTGRLGFFAFACNRYSNMPYQTWEMKPDLKIHGQVNFSLTAAVTNCEIRITNCGFTLITIQGGTTDRINSILGQTISSLHELREVLQESGVNIFPELDAFCYCEGTCEKNYQMEMHLYQCMAVCSLTINFLWSRWNLLAGGRVAVLLMRELLENKKVPTHSTLYVTPLKTAIVDCTEVSTSFSTTGVAGMQYYGDLLQLVRDWATEDTLEKLEQIDPILSDNCCQILRSIRPLSFC